MRLNSPRTKSPGVSLLWIAPLAAFLLGCDSNAAPPIATATPTSVVLALTAKAGPATVEPPRTPIGGATATPAVHGPSDTVQKDDGQSLVLSNGRFFWTLMLPRDWIIAADSGFELHAGNPQQSAFIHLLSQTWQHGNRLANALAYVNYWQHSVFGNVFPPYADGAQVSQSELNAEKFGGPYLRYEFNDSKKGVRYLQVYASGGGPSSLVVTVWAKNIDFDGLKGTLDAIINSVALLQG